ncbi:TPA: envelope stress response protein PspG [Yersinia enterocolitica]|jgi:phage shock protein G|uniref:envelope stress response protein PspG n=1 Tax=Yersinia enterocolitica TaxID=630 RepID=UPI0005DB552A|nr:envelope stress response protein PspG [Yersinia enterocolitica]CNG19575.1 putative inner membrane protein [Yersinia enterocolitica]HDM8291604.1 envelope stress response protein PspG [Yersinia enterocolitica]HDM8295667.1 envelope stress response protein PspG [Yersinia enterocolitica]HDM8320786.1 envelope stress response protein PspG [Yersinia enterocolitica]HDM8333480.1 envelope stress response protein PspG [Yersinia enterocolitica]
MFEIFFVIGFFIMLMVTGISLLGIFAALLVAAAFMMLGGLFVMMIKLLPWLILAVVVVWIWRSMQKPAVRRY